jgi:hypothetical protein
MKNKRLIFVVIIVNLFCGCLNRNTGSNQAKPNVKSQTGDSPYSFEAPTADSFPREKLVHFADGRALDSIEVDFKNFPGSDEYIRKFNLSEDEIIMLGGWGFDSFVAKTPPARIYGPGIVITFYPNRYFRIYNENRDNGEIRSSYGEWKVIDKLLFLKFTSKLVIIDEKAPNMYDRYIVEYFDDDNYYPIFRIPKYEYAYYNLTVFDWKYFPQRTLDFFEFKNNDAPRSRLLLDTLADPPGNIQADSKYGRLLLNPQKTKEYYIDLLGVW